MKTITKMWEGFYKRLGQVNLECPSENKIIRKTMKPSEYKERANVIVKILNTGDSILEIGCGYGGLAQEILEKVSVSYTVVDNELMLDQTKKFLGNKVEYIVADEIETLQNRKFGLFISDYCLSEVPFEYREYIFENIIKNCRKIDVIDSDWYDIEKHLRKYFIIEKTRFHKRERFTFVGERLQ